MDAASTKAYTEHMMTRDQDGRDKPFQLLQNRPSEDKRGLWQNKANIESLIEDLIQGLIHGLGDWQKA